jgi:hypothetical protein
VTVDGSTPTEAEWRATLVEQARTARALKIARARAVLQNANEKTPVMWAKVELATVELAEAADRADVAAKVLWAVHAAATRQPAVEGDE